MGHNEGDGDGLEEYIVEGVSNVVESVALENSDRTSTYLNISKACVELIVDGLNTISTFHLQTNKTSQYHLAPETETLLI